MSPWHTLLNNYQMTLAEDGSEVICKGEQSTHSTRIVPLVHHEVISVVGEDAEKFLQGQLTCDLQDVSQMGSRLGAHCAIKGSMIALYRLMKTDGGFLLRLHRGTAAGALQSLQKYIVFSKAEAKNVSQEMVGLGLIGPGATALVEKLTETAPSETDRLVRSGDVHIIRVPQERYELWMPVEKAPEVIAQLERIAPMGSTREWLLSEIEAGIPDLRPATQETFIPQMANLQAFKGVSFTKGCYTGQEIVTRLQHRGKLNKCMYHLVGECETLPQAGDYLDSTDKERVGQVLYAASADNGQIHMLAIMNKSAEESSLKLAEQNTPLSHAELPYTLDPELFEKKR